MEGVEKLQKLIFEPSWEKALSKKDRLEIEDIFVRTKFNQSDGILLSPIREAMNHKGELLVMVLIHNFSNNEFTLNEKVLTYTQYGKVTAQHTFTHSSVKIEPHTSMPWTFIFPVESMSDNLTIDIGCLEIISS